MKKINVLLCGLGMACLLTGCGETLELTEAESEMITEYAVNLLLKYDKYYNDHLVDLSLYEEPVIPQEEESPEEVEEESSEPEENAQEPDTEVVDATEEAQASSIEEFYEIPGFTFQYTGYDMMTSYPDATQNPEEAFFAMEATPGMQLMVLKFQAINQSGTEAELNMLNYNTKMRFSINGEASKSALSTMLLNDIQTYRGTVGAYELAELVAVVEVPTGTSVQSLSMTLRSDDTSATIGL
ncbi:MAG: hypothetical protein NC231_06035 [Bacillus sp. (in: Bacteria)]|nr:hypothetical protein [Bacillus sp. (in: firmicutes)]MCM1427610.1 hypothetical protein [Eubacterium sp.]